jgi:hypothetical protein
MSNSIELSMETLLAEDGMPVSAGGRRMGLAREDLERIAVRRAARDRAAAVAKAETALREAEDRLSAALREYDAVLTGDPVAIG